MAASIRVWVPLMCALAAIHIQGASSIRCWECNSRYDRNCADPFHNETFAITDCDQRDLDHLPDKKATICRKIIQKVRDDYRFVRSCGWLSNEREGSDCFKRAGTFNVLLQYCSCEADGCNSSPHTTSAAWTAITLLLLLLAIK